MSAFALIRVPGAPPAAGAALIVEAMGREFALHVGAVRSIVRVGRITRAHGGPGFLLGFANLKGQILPVLSLGRRLDPANMAAALSPFAVVVETPGRTAALAVDRVGAVVLAQGADILDTPAQLDASIAPFAAAVLRHGGVLAPVIDVNALLDYPPLATDGDARTVRGPFNGGLK